MRRFFLTLIGLILLAAAALLAWSAYGPLPTETRTTGGVLTTQAEIAAQGDLAAQGAAPDLGVVTDQGASSTNALNAQPQIEGEAVQEITSAGNASEAVAPPLASGPELTTDVVLDDNTEVQVAPLSIQPAPQVAPDGQGGAAGLAGAYEQRVVELEWPRAFRVDSAGSVRITLKMLANGAIQPVAEIANDEVLATPILLTDRYDTYDAFVTANLSAPDFTIDSLNSAAQTLQRGSELEWRWTLTPHKTGTFRIVLTLNITWQPKPNTGGTPINAGIWGQAVEVEANYVFGGLTIPQASAAATVLAVMGFVTQVPFLAKILEMLIFGRRRRRVRRTTSRKRRR